MYKRFIFQQIIIETILINIQYSNIISLINLQLSN